MFATPMKPYLPYARVSSDEQKDAETIKTQIDAVEQYSRVNRVPIASEWILDDGVTGMIPLDERPGGARALELLRTGRYAGLICLNHKRIGRKALVIHQAVEQVEVELGLDILAIREPVPSNLAPGARALMRSLYAGVAQYDREEFLAAMRAGKVRAAREGRWSGGRVPYGYQLETVKQGGRSIKRLIINPETAQIALEIFTLYAEGKTQAVIAGILNARHVPHPSDDPKQGRSALRWHQSTISIILRNPVYKGEGQWGRRYETGNTRRNSPPERIIYYEDYQPPSIVTPEVWERCAHLRRQNTVEASRNARRFYLLRRLVYCGVCGKSYTGSGRRGGLFYYQCTSRVQGRYEKHCGNLMARADHLEREVLQEVRNLINAPDELLREITIALGEQEEQPKKDTVRDLAHLIRAKEREQERVITWARQGRITDDEMDAQLLMLREEVAALEGERECQERARREALGTRERLLAIEDFLQNLARRVDELPPEEMAEVVRHFVSKIVVTPRETGRGRPRPHAEMFLSLTPPLYSWKDPASSNCLT
jgi:site-specific DNA recombinase